MDDGPDSSGPSDHAAVDSPAGVADSALEENRPMDLPEQSQYVVGWGTLSLVNAGLAQAKSRSGLLWWLFSLLLGPLATLLIVVLPSVDRAPPALSK
jgi:hypothetical protein